MLVTCTITPSVLKQEHIVQELCLFRSSCDQMERHLERGVSITGPVDTLPPPDGNRFTFRNIVFFFWTRCNVQRPRSTWSKIYIYAVYDAPYKRDASYILSIMLLRHAQYPPLNSPSPPATESSPDAAVNVSLLLHIYLLQIYFLL